MGVWWGRTWWNTPGLRAGCLLTPESGKLFPLLQPENAFRYLQDNFKRQSNKRAKGTGENSQWAGRKQGLVFVSPLVMEGTLWSERAQLRLPVPRLLLPPGLSSQTGHAQMTDMPLISSLIHLGHNPTTSWVWKEAWVCSPCFTMGWAFFVAKGTRISLLSLSTFKSGTVYAWTAGRTLLLLAHRSGSLGLLQKGSVQRAPHCSLSPAQVI